MTRARQDSFRLLLAALLAVLLMATAACQPAGDNAGGSPQKPAAAGQTASNPAGTPPCMRYVSRGDTKKIADTVSAHPVISAVALHIVAGLLCGGVLCLLGAGISVVYVGHEASKATAAHECLRVRILPDGHEWRLVDITPSNQSPYCTD